MSWQLQSYPWSRHDEERCHWLLSTHQEDYYQVQGNIQISQSFLRLKIKMLEKSNTVSSQLNVFYLIWLCCCRTIWWTLYLDNLSVLVFSSELRIYGFHSSLQTKHSQSKSLVFFSFAKNLQSFLCWVVETGCITVPGMCVSGCKWEILGIIKSILPAKHL